MKLRLWLIAIVFVVIGISCKNEILEPADSQFATRTARNSKLAFAVGNPHLKIAVVSDIHYMSPSLLTNNGAAGAAFQEYLNQDPKLIEYSDAIFRTVLGQLETQQPDILLVPGDLTKDGERVSHEAMAAYLTTLTNRGTKVFVIPGNHDINNAKAKRFDGDNAYPVATVQAADFASIYGNFGYANSERDPNSLSYLAKPYDDLWILAIDASRYEEYGPEGDIWAGRIKPETLSWVLAKMAQAKAQNVTVYAMMHHNLVEHYTGQSYLDPGYVIDNWESVAPQLADAGLKILFTGHYHANDITPYSHNGNSFYEIETGSLVSTPSPYRVISVKNKHMEIQTNQVQAIDASLPGGMSFPAYSNLFINTHLDGYFNYLLVNQFGAPQDLATFAAPLFRNAIKAHWAGDEKMPPDQRKPIAELETVAPPFAAMLNSLWTDLGVRDNNLPLDY